MSETILVVDDEDSVRRTFREWLDGAALGCRILTAHDAESALVQANLERIDLAILDWNLGAGNDGLRVLEDLQVFNADVVAILITGFADQATPVQAMRMGVRDYLDKNQDLNRTTFLKAVRGQLERIRPARRERQIQQGLREFHDALEKVLPLVRTTTALQGPVPFSDAIRALVRALVLPTRATSAHLVVVPEDGPLRAFDRTGTELTLPAIDRASTLATALLALRSPTVMDLAIATGLTLLPFEQASRTLLAVPLEVGPRLGALLELFDPVDESGQPTGFREEDRRLTGWLVPLAEDLLRQAIAEQQTRQLLLDAVQAALDWGRNLSETLGTASRPEDPPPTTVLETIRQGLSEGHDAEATVQLAEAIRSLSVKFGPEAVRHCIAMVESLHQLLARTCGTDEATP